MLLNNFSKLKSLFLLFLIIGISSCGKDSGSESNGFQAPTIVDPSQGDEVASCLWLRFLEVENATAYTIQLSQNESFNPLYWEEELEAGTPATTTSWLNRINIDTDMFCRIRAINGSETTDWTTVLAITIENDPNIDCFNLPPTIPQLINPSNEAILSGQTQIFDWEPSDFVSYYTIQFHTDPEFPDETQLASLETDSDDPFLEFEFLPEFIGERYYWRVKAVKAFDLESDWSFTRTFLLLE